MARSLAGPLAPMIAACLSEVFAQPPPRRDIAPEATCKTCSIELGQPRLILGKGQGLDRRPSDMVWGPDGRTILLQAGAGGLPLVIGGTGEPVGELGRTGGGPGEFRAAVFGASSGDTLFLFDRTIGDCQ